jgi:50S ribosomal protein L16 3-hydroxylase
VISHHPGQNDSYELHWGPLSNEEANDWISIQDTTSNSNKTKQTLVVNDIDRFYPPLADWIHDNFKFIPHWRMDDGQISLAEEMGGIGPHVDNYDVFLIQMSGKRRWQVGREKISVKDEMDRSLPDIDVRILDDWGADSEYEDWILNPGDVLYLPPRIGEFAVVTDKQRSETSLSYTIHFL